MSRVKKEKDISSGRANPARSYFRGLKQAPILRADPVLKSIHSLAQKEDTEVYLVGGLIRNLILSEKIVPDYDFAVKDGLKGFPDKIAALLKGTAFVLDKEAPSYRVVVKKGEGKVTLDFSPVKDNDIILDLKKRDFTVNASAISLPELFEGKKPLIDPLGCLSDAKRKVLRAASSGAFKDDPLRCLRAVRLSQQYGLKIEPSTIKLIKGSARLLKRTSAERIRDELIIIFTTPGTAKSLRLLFDLSIIKTILPEIAGWDDVEGYDLLTHSLKTVTEAEKALSGLSARTFPKVHKELKAHFSGSIGPVGKGAFFKLAAFFHDTGKPYTISRQQGRLRFIGHDFEGSRAVKDILRRLKFSRAFIGEASNLIKNHHRVFMLAKLEEATPRAKAHLLRASGDEAGVDLLLLSLADARATRGGEDKELSKLVKEMLEFYYGAYKRKRPKPLLTGHEIMRIFSVPEGSLVGQIMNKVSEGVEAGAIKNKRQAIKNIKDWLSKEKA